MKKAYYYILFGAAIVLVFILSLNVRNIFTVSELGDEAGYFYNAAFFTKTNWDSVGAYNPYYGYGYSLLLLPLWANTKNGVELIRGAVCVNIGLITLSYFMITYLLNRIVFKNKSIFAPLISFVMCFSPYIVSSTFKTICECTIVFHTCLCLVLFYKMLSKNKPLYAVLFGICLAYGYAIHTRLLFVIFIFLFVWMATSLRFGLINGKKFKKYIRTYIAAAVGFVVAFLVIYLVKRQILSYRESIALAKSNQGNIVDSDTISQRFSWLFNSKNTGLYLLSFFAKFFYAVVESFGLCFIGTHFLIKSMRKDAQHNNHAQYGTKLFILIGWFSLILIFTLIGPGSVDKFTTFFYARYYESLLIIFVAFTIAFALKEKVSLAQIVTSITGVIILRFIAGILKYKLKSEVVHLDTNRAPFFAVATKFTDNYGTMLNIMMCICIGVLILFYLTSNKVKMAAVVVILFVFVVASSVCIAEINRINELGKADAEIALNILEDKDKEHVLFVDDNSYNYSNFFARFQVLLKDEPLLVDKVNPTEAEYKALCDTCYIRMTHNDYIVLYKFSPINDYLVNYGTNYVDGDVFRMYYITSEND
ncbi:MAG: hypothetical protein MJ108_01270 [Saccharofermentans sp.]|nr:hypothetical protein [Saccharofermentans sp.]